MQHSVVCAYFSCAGAGNGEEKPQAQAWLGFGGFGSAELRSIWAERGTLFGVLAIRILLFRVLY